MGSQPKFSNAIQLEEITHFERDKPTRSILSTHKKFRKKSPKKVSYETPYEKQLDNESIPSSENEDKNPIAGSSNSNKVQPLRNSPDLFKANNQFSEESSSEFGRSDESDEEFYKDTITGSPGFNSNSTRLNGGLHTSGGDGHDGLNSTITISDENLFSVPSIQVTKSDLIFTVIAFLTTFGELVTDFVLAIWHYNNEQKLASGLTTVFMSTGGIGLLYQFGLLQQDHLDRLFRRGKRVRILVSCFPPAATLIVSYHSIMTAWKAIKDPMFSQQYFKITEFLQSLARIQSFFQAAPQATLQLLILLENIHETSWEKALFTLANILISLTVMTNANLPLKTDTQEDRTPVKAAYIPLSRMFMGLRMFSSLGSRTMALTYLLIGCRCILQPNATLFGSTMIAIALSLFPRLVFTLTDYFTGKVVTRRNLERYREQPEVGVSSSHPIEKLTFVKLFVGYLATIFFPVGDPLWLFWYLWCESGIFIMFGNVAGTVTKDCVDSSVDGIYTGVFVIVFIIVPVIIPYIRTVVQRHKIHKFMRVLQVVEDREEGDSGRCSGNPISTDIVEGLGINDNPNYDPNSPCATTDSVKISANYSRNPLPIQGGEIMA